MLDHVAYLHPQPVLLLQLLQRAVVFPSQTLEQRAVVSALPLEPPRRLVRRVPFRHRHLQLERLLGQRELHIVHLFSLFLLPFAQQRRREERPSKVCALVVCDTFPVLCPRRRHRRLPPRQHELRVEHLVTLRPRIRRSPSPHRQAQHLELAHTESPRGSLRLIVKVFFTNHTPLRSLPGPL